MSSIGGGSLYHSVKVPRVGVDDFLVDRLGVIWWRTDTGYTRMFSHWSDAYPLADNPPPWASDGETPTTMVLGVNTAIQNVGEPITGGILLGMNIRGSSGLPLAIGTNLVNFGEDVNIAIGTQLSIGSSEHFNGSGEPTASDEYTRTGVVLLGHDQKATGELSAVALLGAANTVEGTSAESKSIYVLGAANDLTGPLVSALALGADNNISNGLADAASNSILIGAVNELIITEGVSYYGGNALLIGVGNELTPGEGDSYPFFSGALIGVSNLSDSGQTFILGVDNSAEDSASSVLVGVDNDSSGSHENVLIGVDNDSSGSATHDSPEADTYGSGKAVLVGVGNRVISGIRLIGIGTGNTLEGADNSAVGYANVLSGTHGVAVGVGSEISGDKSLSIGTGNGIDGDRSWVLGADGYGAATTDVPENHLTADEAGVLVARTVEILRSPQAVPELDPTGDESTYVILHSADGTPVEIGATDEGNLTQDGLELGWVGVPSSTSDTGVAGQKAYDASYLYVCVATDTWVRSPLGSW